MRLYPGAGTPDVYRLGLDVLGETEAFAPGLGAVRDFDTTLEYFRRAAGSPLTCGPAANYATLLPTRAAQTAAAFAVFPNPTGAAATVALTAPAQPGTRLTLCDALGRPVWEAALAPPPCRWPGSPPAYTWCGSKRPAQPQLPSASPRNNQQKLP